MTAVRREACSESRRWRIAVDAMGGDHAPEAIVGGAVLAARELPVEILLVGEESRLKPLAEASQAPANVSVVHASEVIAMDAHPVEAVRRQRDSSIVVAARLVKAGEADALVSAGSTGAAMACTFLEWGRIKGIDRPAISSGAAHPGRRLHHAGRRRPGGLPSPEPRPVRSDGEPLCPAGPRHRTAQGGPAEQRRGGRKGLRAGARGVSPAGRHGRPQFHRKRGRPGHPGRQGRRGGLRRLRGQRGAQVRGRDGSGHL